MKFVFYIFLTISFGAFALEEKKPVDAKIQETQVILEKIVNFLKLYKHDCGHYPQKLVSLKKNVENCKNWGPLSYASIAFQFRDAWGHDISYILQNSQYTLKSFGADGKEGGTDVNMDVIRKGD